MYKAKLKTNEIIAIPDSDIEELLKQSKAAIHVYNYICAYTNDQEDIGYARGLRIRTIADDLNMAVSTVMLSMESLADAGLIGVEVVKYGIYDITVSSYAFMFEDGYVQYSAEVLFSDEFMAADKAVIAGYMRMYYVNFKDIVADLRGRCKTDKSDYHKHLNSVRKTRELKRRTILGYIRRNNSNDADRVVAEIVAAKWMDIARLGDFDLREDDKFVVAIPGDTLRAIFKPKQEIRDSYIEDFKTSFRTACSLVFNTAIGNLFNRMDHLEDLTQMTRQYGKGLMDIAVTKVRGMYRDDKLIDANGDEVINVCGYIRQIVENTLADMKQRDDYFRIIILNRFGKFKVAAE